MRFPLRSVLQLLYDLDAMKPQRRPKLHTRRNHQTERFDNYGALIENARLLGGRAADVHVCLCVLSWPIGYFGMSNVDKFD